MKLLCGLFLLAVVSAGKHTCIFHFLKKITALKEILKVQKAAKSVYAYVHNKAH